MKFDCIIGNPPYQGSHGADKLWVKFAKQSTEKSEVVAFVTPNAWIHPIKPLFKEISQILSQNLTYLDDKCSKHFPNIGESIGAWIWNKNTGTSEIYEKIEKPLWMSIYYKLVSNNPPVFFSNVDNGKSKKEKDEFHTIPVYHTANQTWWAPASFKDDRLKLIINASGSFKYEISSEKLVGHNAFGIYIDNEKQAENILSFIHSKLYKTIVRKDFEGAAWNWDLQKFKFLGKEKLWTDEELYSYFNLTQEEIAYVERNSKTN